MSVTLAVATPVSGMGLWAVWIPPEGAALRLSRREADGGNKERAILGNGGCKGERPVLGDNFVVAAVIQQLETVIGKRRVVRGRGLFTEKSDDGSADAERDGRAGDGHAGDIGRGGAAAGAGCNYAGLRRRARLGEDRDGIRGARGDLSCESKSAVGSNREVVAAVILKNQAGADETGDGAADGVAEHAGNVKSDRGGSGGARAVRNRAELGRNCRLSEDGNGVRAIHGSRKVEGTIGGDGQAVATIVLKNQTGSE